MVQTILYEGLFSMLHAIPPKVAKLSLIIDGDGWSPSQPFCHPIGGCHAPDKRESEIERVWKSSITSAKVPDVLPIQHPTGTEYTPLDTASPIAGRRGTFQPLSLDAPSMPKLGHTSECASNASGDKVTSLLLRIPNFSFMLQSTLVLPKK
jgi:hypothetical protein